MKRLFTYCGMDKVVLGRFTVPHDSMPLEHQQGSINTQHKMCFSALCHANQQSGYSFLVRVHDIYQYHFRNFLFDTEVCDSHTPSTCFCQVRSLKQASVGAENNSTESMRSFLAEYDMKHITGHTCFITKCSCLRHTRKLTPIGKNSSQLYINMTTGEISINIVTVKCNCYILS